MISISGREAAVRDVDASFCPSFYLAFGRYLAIVNRVWHRFALRGLERIPETPCLFVGNHSGLGIADVLCLLGGWRARFGLKRRVVGMTQDLFVAMPIVGAFARRFGAVYASPASARAAFARGHDVVCFPGGDIDSCRSIFAAREVRFGPRRGYARLALETGVPIVLIATWGSHYSYVVLPGAEHIAAVARALGLKRSRAFPLTLGMLGFVLAIASGSLPWIALALVVAVLPAPVRITSEILAPIDVCEATRHITDPEARVAAADLIVRRALGSAVATLRHETAT